MKWHEQENSKIVGSFNPVDNYTQGLGKNKNNEMCVETTT